MPEQISGVGFFDNSRYRHYRHAIDLSLANIGAYGLIHPESDVLVFDEGYRIYRTLSPEDQARFPRERQSKLRYLWLREMGFIPNLQQPPEELVDAMSVSARHYVRENYGVDTSLSDTLMWDLLQSRLGNQSKRYVFATAETQGQSVGKNFPLGRVFSEVSVSGLKKRLDPVKATRLLVGGLIGRREESLKAAERAFDKEKLERAREWIRVSHLRPGKIFRELAPLLNSNDTSDARELLSYFIVLPNEDVNDLVSGVLGLFGEDEKFSSLLMKMQDGTFSDLFDNTRLMSCAFLPSGIYCGAALRYHIDPDIGLLHVVPKTVDGLLSPIGVSNLVNAVDEVDNKWLIVDSVEGGIELERVRESIWIPAVYQGIMDVGRDVNARNIMFNSRVFNGKPKRFLEYVSKRNPQAEVYLRKEGIHDSSFLDIPDTHFREALEIWKGGIEGTIQGFVKKVR